MKTVKTVELSVDDARKMLVDWIHDTLVNDSNYLKELIATQGFGDWYEPVDKMNPDDVADRVVELNIAEGLAHEHDAEIVTVRLDSLNAVVVYDVNNPGCNGPSVEPTMQEAVAVKPCSIF